MKYVTSDGCLFTKATEAAHWQFLIDNFSDNGNRNPDLDLLAIFDWYMVDSGEFRYFTDRLRYGFYEKMRRELPHIFRIFLADRNRFWNIVDNGIFGYSEYKMKGFSLEFTQATLEEIVRKHIKDNMFPNLDMDNVVIEFRTIERKDFFNRVTHKEVVVEVTV